MLQITDEFRIQTNREKFESAPLWQCLEWALEDLRIVEKKPGYYIDMSTYYAQESTYCYVCLAGASMVNRLDYTHYPHDNAKLAQKISAVSCVGHGGSISDALLVCDYDAFIKSNQEEILDLECQFHPFGINRPLWERYMGKAIDFLKRNNI